MVNEVLGVFCFHSSFLEQKGSVQKGISHNFSKAEIFKRKLLAVNEQLYLLCCRQHDRNNRDELPTKSADQRASGSGLCDDSYTDKNCVRSVAGR